MVAAGHDAGLVAERLRCSARSRVRQRSPRDRRGSSGYPCPRIILVIGTGELLDVPVQVMELVPGSTILTSMTSSPCEDAPAVGSLPRSLRTGACCDSTGRRTRIVRRMSGSQDDADPAERARRSDRILRALGSRATRLCLRPLGSGPRDGPHRRHRRPHRRHRIPVRSRSHRARRHVRRHRVRQQHRRRCVVHARSN